ncbi:TonB-dependent receptor [Olivibacter sitiensis]|uniref:TonB-dependent receptor n=1 Tax=Olivibacter sitiensis TaxID=376470 RepID=UPI000401A874|nr:TonB-dependent receptor [Olivibacter sitiensis]
MTPNTKAQTGKPVSGTVQDSTGLSVISASVRLTSDKDTLQAITDLDGKFAFPSVKASSFTLTITSIGFEALTRSFTIAADRSSLVIAPITMKYSSQMLQEVSVTGGTLVTMKGDTVEYNAKDYRVRDNALAEELVKKLDGVQVDKDGNITAQGETVSRVRINGKDFFGGDIKTATQNLPADIIEKLQIIDDYGDQANLTGNRTGDPEKILNIVIPEDKNKGYLGRVGAGGGTEDRYQAGGMFRASNNKSEATIVGDMNNNNNQAFNFNTRGAGARRMPGGMGGAGGAGGAGGFGGGSNGLTKSYSIGLNVRSDINDKITTYGNYSYNHSDNTTTNITDATYNYPSSQIVNYINGVTNAISNNHRFDWNLEYKMSQKSFLKLSPTFSLGNSTTILDQTNDQTTNGERQVIYNINDDGSRVPSYGLSGLYNFRIDDKGRNAFINFSLNSSKTKQDQDRIINTLNYSDDDVVDTYTRQLIDLDNKGLNGGASLSYIEPLSGTSNLEFTYDYNFANYDNLRRADTLSTTGSIDYSPQLSTDFDYTFATHKVGLTYRYRTEKTTLQLGGAVLPTRLTGNSLYLDNNIDTKRTGFYFVPVFRYEYKASRTKVFTAEYNGSASEPSFSQIQPVVDMSNPQNTITGNPELNAQFNHSLRLRYRNFDFATGNVFFAMLMANLSEDRIVADRSVIMDERYGTVQQTSYLNANGYYDVRGFYNYSRPYKNRAYVLSFRGGANYVNNVTYTEGVENIAKNWVLNQGIDLQINPQTWLEIRPGVNYTFNTISNTTGNQTSTNIQTWAATLNNNITFIPTWVWGLDLSATKNIGYGNTVNANPTILNTFLEKQFFKAKNGMLRLSAFDLLNQQVSVGRTITENSIVDVRNNRLGRYFMLSFTYRFQKFGGVSGAGDPNERQMGFPRPGGAGPGGRPGGL